MKKIIKIMICSNIKAMEKINKRKHKGIDIRIIMMKRIMKMTMNLIEKMRLTEKNLKL